MKLSKKIQNYADMFEYKQRGDENICVFNNKASQDLKDSVYEAHGDLMPDDWIFNIYESILSDLINYDIETIEDIEDIRHEIVDGLIDIYNGELTSWLNSNLYFAEYVNEAKREFGASEEADIYNDIQLGQYKAIDEIFSYVIELLS